MFEPEKHLSKIKTKQGMQDYLKIQWRLVWFREHCPAGTIETEVVQLDLDQQIAVFKATVTDGNGGIATGHGSESARDFGDWIEKAETKSIGRALAALGYGTAYVGDELDEGERIADAPVDRPTGQKPIATEEQTATETIQEAPASKEAMEALNKIRLALGMPLSRVKHTRKSAKEEYEELLAEWNERQAKGRAS